MSHRTSLSRHLTQFVTDSSIRSLRRTVISETALLRTFWTVFVLACFAGMTCHLALISMNFVKGDLAVDLQFSSTANQPFPSVSYCDGSRFGGNAVGFLATGSVLTPIQFSAYVRERVRKFYQRQPSAERGYLLLIESYSNYLATLLGTFIKSNRSLHEISNLGVSSGAPIVRLLLVTGRVIWLVPGDFSLLPFHHPEYLNCYTVTLPGSLSKLTQSVTLVLPAVVTNITNSSIRDELSTGFPIDGLTSASGFLFDLHSEFAVPFSHSKLLLPSNYYNQVKFTQCSLQRLACSNFSGWFTDYRVGNGTIKKRYFSYTKELCIVQKIRTEVRRRCNCTLDMGLMNLTDRTARCNAFAPDDTVEAYSLRDNCVDDVLSSSQSYDEACQSSCKEFWFPATVSGASYMPMNQLQRCVMEQAIYEVNYQGAGISDVEAALLSNASATQSAANLCANSSRSRAFIVEFSRNPFLLQSFRQTPITTLAVFLCQVGSICGIWSGLSIAIVAEAFDLFYQLVKSRRTAGSSVGSLQLTTVKEMPTAVS